MEALLNSEAKQKNKLEVIKLAAFADGMQGGNPAGVAIVEAFPSEQEMIRLAAEVGFSETVFAVPQNNGFRVRYFSPATEVAFCGHATVALGYALFRQYGSGTHQLVLNHANISVSADNSGRITLISPSTTSRPADQKLLEKYLPIFGLKAGDLSTDIPPGIANAGNDHLVLALNAKQRLDEMAYDFERAKTAMQEDNLVTVALLYQESPVLMHFRNAFAYGDVYEDPATGAAAAAVTGYLREQKLLTFHNSKANLRFLQGHKMGVPCVLDACASNSKGEGIALSGLVRVLG
ncbi:PhzF family phenazine biosynthesis isomerase [Aliiglaciecola sp. CAU 1673]|uniref:PhzF family phenazine biosynthesis protein n=1 Tax=Aliiglaciecola sp. CAU 1673 TaxID=3032595 RepID=UPI0023DC42EA|nr:PhzF family phenazine biosynthesis isomerase [Aliiglaciecola sp. CAU 1673]MDF2177005.1 PhzF family phenazine biosynthesis isomerase [Aliiglaciecola sp. CAU 1673]